MEVVVRLAQRLAVLGRALRVRRLRGDSGLSVMEVIVAMTIIGGVMSSASLFFIGGLRNTGGQSQRQTAVTLANQTLESTQSLAPDALLSGRDCSSVYTFTHTTAAASITTQDQIAASSSVQTTAGNCDISGSTTNPAVPLTSTAVVNGITYSIDTYIDVCWLLGNKTSGDCVSTNSTGTRTRIYRVSVDVSYAPTSGLTCSGYTTGRCDYVASTLIDPTDDPTFNSNVTTPAVTAVSPSGGVLVGTTNSITLTGTKFVNGIALSIVSGGGIITAITSNTGTAVTFTLTAGSTAGNYVITLLNPDGGTTTTSIAENALPVISSVTPTTVTAGSTATLTLNGTGFKNGFTVSINSGGTLASAAFVSSTQVTVSFTSNGTLGMRTLTLTNPDTGSATGTFTVTSNPTISSISPAGVGASATKTLTITGTGFVNGATASDGVDTFGAVTVVSSTQATVSVTATSGTGTRTFKLTNPDGGAATKTFTVNAKPTISSFSSLTCTAATQTLTITGT
jgi:Tfp pilus assembly protein PilV